MDRFCRNMYLRKGTLFFLLASIITVMVYKIIFCSWSLFMLIFLYVISGVNDCNGNDCLKPAPLFYFQQ